MQEDLAIDNLAIEAVSVGRDSIAVLLGTDRLYFEMGATRSTKSGLELLYMDGFQHTPSGSVIWGVDPHCEAVAFRHRLIAAEEELLGLGGQVLRVYAKDPVPRHLLNVFHESSYRPRTEVALLAPVETVLERAVFRPNYEFCAVETESHWRLKEALHDQECGQADGYKTLAAEWVRLERHKCETGGMLCYLLLDGPSPVATVALILDRGIARLKNLYVHPSFRKHGVGLTTVCLLAKQASNFGYQQFGCFALKNGVAIHVYQRAGMRVVASATEFSKFLR